MSSSPSLWDRLRRARMVQVLAVYLGASWVVLQISDTLVDALSLPEWVNPVTLILLLIGLLVIMATAWVQSHPMTAEGERTGDLPRNWELAPREALSSIRRGRLPHLTWARAILGGVAAISLLFMGAGVRMAFEDGSPFGPAEATASVAAEGIAVVPFAVRGTDLEIWREGMMDLLANGLDGLGGFRTIDARTVMARWREHVGDTGTADLRTTLALGRGVGARYVIEGSVVGLVNDVRLAANVYDLETGEKVTSASAEGPAADVMRLADQLSVAIMRNLLAAVGQGGEADFTAETITTTSLPAMRAFLEGENHYRNGDFADAVAAYERAVAADSTFAIALVRLSEAYGWLESANSERMQQVGELALAQAHRMSPRYQFIMTGWNALNHGSAEGLASLKEAVQKYPDDPEAWFLLAETYIHIGGPTYGTAEELWQALDRATSLDPGFAPYLVHVAEHSVIRGDAAAARAALERYEALTGNRDGLEHIDLALRLLLGDEAEVDRALATLDQQSERTLDIYWGSFVLQHDHVDRDAAVDAALARKTDSNRAAFQGYFAALGGELARGAQVMSDAAVNPADRAIFAAQVYALWDVAPAADALDPAACEQATLNQLCAAFVGVAAARLGRWPVHAQILRRVREEASRLAAEDSVRADRYSAIADVVEGAAAWRRGEVQRGRALLESRAGRLGNTAILARLELAGLEEAAGRHALALRQYRSNLNSFMRSRALYGMATMHEQLGEPEEARRYWASLVTMTEDGDDLPRIREARAALERLAAER